MEYQLITQEQYNAIMRDLIKITESLHEKSQDVGDERATIGYGYTFNRNNNVEIWTRSGIILTDAEWQLLHDIDSAKKSQKTALGLGFPKTLSEDEGNLLIDAVLPENVGVRSCLLPLMKMNHLNN